MPTLTLIQAQGLVVRTLTRCNTDAENARSVARALIAAECDGLKGHGLSRVPMYAKQAKVRKIDGTATPFVARSRPGLIAIDAANGFAFPAIELAEEALPEAARSQGIAAAAIRRSSHCGAAGHPVERLAEKGLVALMFVNTPGAMAPWGGSRAVFGTNPVAFACPLPGRAPLVIDLSLSEAARGKVMVAARQGKPIPAGWALDSQGAPTTDAQAALEGSKQPMGGAKGAMLAMVVEALACALTGAAMGFEADSFFVDAGNRPRIGQAFLVIDPQALAGRDVYEERIEAMTAAMLADDGVRLPGARRAALAAKARVEGIEVPDALAAQLRDL